MKKAYSRFLTLALAIIFAMCGGALGEGAGAAKDTHILGGDEFPVRFDLREYGVVTPVKFQNPWSTCWSFGGIAAAESSICLAPHHGADRGEPGGRGPLFHEQGR